MAKLEEKEEELSVVQMNIHQKILAIADAAGVFEKTKNGYNFKYTPEEDIQAKITGAMQKYHIMLYHSIVPSTLKVTPHSYEKKGKVVNEVIVQADTIYTWVNTDNPEEKITLPWVIVGQMEDASQAFGAGETYCNRYFLMKSLQLATSEDDPDSYRSKQQEAEAYAETKEAKKLQEAINEVKNKGTQLLSKGIDKETIRGVVGKYNNGKQNPSSIEDINVCKKIVEELDSLMINEKEKSTPVKKKQKTNQEDKGEKNDIQ